MRLMRTLWRRKTFRQVVASDFSKSYWQFGQPISCVEPFPDGIRLTTLIPFPFCSVGDLKKIGKFRPVVEKAFTKFPSNIS